MRKLGAKSLGETVFGEGGGFGLLSALGRGGDAAFKRVGGSGDLRGGGRYAGKCGGVIGEPVSDAAGFGEEFAVG